jgi:FtsH-binding integral membrane protein
MSDRTSVPLPPIPEGCGILPTAHDLVHGGGGGDLMQDSSAMNCGLAGAVATGCDSTAPDWLERRYRTVLARALALCSGALLLSAGLAASMVHSSVLQENVAAGQVLAKAIFVSQLLFLAFCRRFIERLGIQTAAVLLFGYAAFCGLEFSALLPPAWLATAFLCAGLMYAGAALWGYLRGSDLAHPAVPIFMILAAGPLVGGLNRALGMPPLSWSVSAAAVVVFAVLAAFHGQEIRDFYQDFDDDDREGWKASLVGALLLMLNSVNVYLLVASLWVQIADWLSDGDDGHHDHLPDR